MQSKRTAQAQIAANEAAFRSVPTNHILAPQNVVLQVRHATPNSQQPSSVAQELRRPALPAESHPPLLHAEFSDSVSVSAGERSPRLALQASGVPYPPDLVPASTELGSQGPSQPEGSFQASRGLTLPGPSQLQQEPLLGWQSMDYEPQTLHDESPGTGTIHGTLSPHAALRFLQGPPPAESHPAAMQAGINALPFANHQFVSVI